MARRPSIKSPCNADRHHGPGERIAEFSAPNGKGGLIGVRQHDNGAVTVNVYRCDDGVIVYGPADPVRDAAQDMLAALRLALPVLEEAERHAHKAAEGLMREDDDMNPAGGVALVIHETASDALEAVRAAITLAGG